uniref:Uncharacterized protein n=1 Tax=Arundo donax TaxID=35708 RepID=A0A0A9GQC7_ARUDO
MLFILNKRHEMNPIAINLAKVKKHINLNLYELPIPVNTLLVLTQTLLTQQLGSTGKFGKQ